MHDGAAGSDSPRTAERFLHNAPSGAPTRELRGAARKRHREIRLVRLHALPNGAGTRVLVTQ